MIYLNATACQASIHAVLPTYDQHGNDASKVIYSNGICKMITNNVSHVVMEWLYSLKVDLIAQHMWSGGLLGHEDNNPIIMSENMALIPVETRKPINTKDTCYGYIMKHSIKDFNEDHILLHSDIEIPYFSPIKVLSDKILDANALLYVYRTDPVMQEHKAANY